ncbi:MAG: hypothetical protein ACOCYT_02880 [Chloroflexota bacterium]
MQGMNLRRLLIGAPLATNQLIHQRLNRVKALAVFSSDALSSSAYATEAIPLDVVQSPYHEIGRPLLDYLHDYDLKCDSSIPTIVVLPEFVVSKWWERLLHNGTSITIREALYHDQIERGKGRLVINVPYRIGDALYEPEMVGTLPEVAPVRVDATTE